MSDIFRNMAMISKRGNGVSSPTFIKYVFYYCNSILNIKDTINEFIFSKMKNQVSIPNQFNHIILIANWCFNNWIFWIKKPPKDPCSKRLNIAHKFNGIINTHSTQKKVIVYHGLNTIFSFCGFKTLQ